MSDNIKKSLRDRAREFSVSLPFMDGKEKGQLNELKGTINTLCDYGFLPDENGEPYAVFIVKERPSKFYFGGEVLTDRLTTLDAEGYGEEIRSEGLPILMTDKKARKGGRTYTNVEFYPEA